MKHKIYVYGTLRPFGETHHLVPGRMYDLGWFPGIVLLSPDSHEWVVTEVIEADDEKLAELDVYEGYDAARPDTSLYLRVPYLDGWIYVYNSDMSGRRMIRPTDTGVQDWAVHKGIDAPSCSAILPSAVPQSVYQEKLDEEV